MSPTRFALHAAVYLILRKDNQILLMRRYHTGWRDGSYTLPAGHLDGGETVADCMSRETREETGIQINPDSLSVVHTVHHIGDKEYIDFYLSTNDWTGTPEIKEPHKCDDMNWFPINHLPSNLLPNVHAALTNFKNDHTFSEFSW